MIVMSKIKSFFKKLGKKKTILLIVGIVLILIILVVAIFFITRKKVETPKPKKVKKEEPIVKKVEIIDLDSNTRPYAVMINNNSAVWKYQSGLNDAYIVYELLVEGGITREMALFKDREVPKIQSVRSSRHYYLDYALENDAIYVHWGWSPQAQSDIRTLGINNINGLTYEGVYFFRDKSVSAAYEHKGYTTSEYINKAIEKLGYRSTTEEKPLLNYSVDPIDLSKMEEVQDAKYIGIKFSNGYTVKFTYDEASKSYFKTQNTTEMNDFNSGERMTTKNIITYQISYSGISGDNKGRQNANNIGSGDGYFISEGKAVPITWEKSARSSKTVYKFKDGKELNVNDGRTYIEIQPSNQILDIQGEIPA